ncbi:pneumococcal-type histidine triad protein [Streptococcus porci]|uniref:pneumococcal-type histidine triad protein n=1 Tax=Streptococcus porci TaxID=502567 RepID=UPI00042622F0|nr:pneumococcal-type histidine triad protein [Streptococcus porci]
MKQKHTILSLAGIILSCHLILVSCQSKHDTSEKNQKTTVQTSKKAKKESKEEEKNNKKKGISGIDFPTSDGFIFSNEKDIIEKTDDGIIVNHDGHSHFIFYKDLKNSKWAYLVPDTSGQTQQKAEAHPPKVSDKANLALDDGYVFNPQDIVSEDENGYIVRHGDHYHYIWKSSLQGRYSNSDSSITQLPKVPNHNSQPHVLSPLNQPSQKNKISGIDFPTSDGFLFDGKNIKEYTELGILVGHGHHDHFIPYTHLASSKWAHLIPKKQKPNVPSKNDNSTTKTTEDSLLTEKKAYLAEQLQVSVEQIQVVDTPNGKAFIYPHGDHSHSILASLVTIGQPIEDPHADPHAHDKVGIETLKKMGFDQDIIDDILHASAETPFPSNETNPEKMKQWLSTVTALNIGQRQNPLGRFGLDLMPNLEVLGAGFTPIHDITPVLKFKKLKQLWLTNTGIKDYSFVKSLPNLEGLDISQNGVNDVSFLSQYKQLKTLALAGNQITDISILAELPQLQSLNLDHNKISNISSLTHLKHLQAVSLENNQITNLSALNGKEELTRLFVSNNPELDITSLQSEKLEELTAKNSNVTNLEFLKNNPSLRVADLAENKLTSLEGIENAKSLETLDASKNQLTSVKISEEQKSLKTLNVSENKLKNLEGVNDYTSLETLNASHNEVETLTLSQKNESLTYLDVSHNHIPNSELTVNENKIPSAIADNYSKVDSGDISHNTPLKEPPHSLEDKSPKATE